MGLVRQPLFGRDNNRACALKFVFAVLCANTCLDTCLKFSKHLNVFAEENDVGKHHPPDRGAAKILRERESEATNSEDDNCAK